MSVRYCIVCTGFSGTCMLWHLVDALVDAQTRAHAAWRTLDHVHICTLERRDVNGPGMPYAPAEVAPYHLCNNPADKMALFDNDFVDWLQAHRAALVLRYPELLRQADPALCPSTEAATGLAAERPAWQPAPHHFYPRALFGIYLAARFETACARARDHGIDVVNLNGCAAIDGATRDGAFHLTIDNLASGARTQLPGFDKVLLASGHWSAVGHERPHVLPSPYPVAALRQAMRACRPAQPGARLTVYVQGMGPSAVDAILSLCEDGRFELDADGLARRFVPDWTAFQASQVAIVAGSRSGFFPGVRWPLEDIDVAWLTEQRIAALRRRGDGVLALDDLLALLDAECRHAGLAGLDALLAPPFADARAKLLADIDGAPAQRLLHTLVLRARRLRFYQYLDGADKARYDRQFDPHFIRAAVPVPLQNARKLLCLIDAGVLETVTLGYRDAPAGAQPLLPGAVAPDLVVRSHGQDYDLARHPAPLLRNLLERGEIVAYSDAGYYPGGIDASATSAFRVARRGAAGARGARSACLSSFGPVTQYWQNQNNFAAAFVEAAKVTARDWVAALT